MRLVVGVLRGGPSQYDASLKTGASVLGALDTNRYEARDIFVDKAGQWHAYGLPAEPERALRGVDVAFNALHGEFGEAGQVQRLLESLGVRYTGSSAYPAAMAYNKPTMRRAAAAAGIKVPYGALIDADKITDLEATALNIFRSMPQPSVVRPAAGGLGAVVADSYGGLVDALKRAFAHSDKVLVEEYIAGRAAAVGVLDNYRNEDPYALIPQGDAFTHDEKELLTDAAKRAHKALGLAHYSQARLRLGRRGVYLTGVYVLPHLHEGSTLHGALAEVGAPLPHAVEHIVSLAATK